MYSYNYTLYDIVYWTVIIELFALYRVEGNYFPLQKNNSTENLKEQAIFFKIIFYSQHFIIYNIIQHNKLIKKQYLKLYPKTKNLKPIHIFIFITYSANKNRF